MARAQANVLVTGGAGYVGSHTVLLLLERGHRVVVLDNCDVANNSPEQQDTNNNNNNNNQDDHIEKLKSTARLNPRLLPESLRRVEQLAAGKQLAAFYNIDLCHCDGASQLDEILSLHKIDVVVHFAALKSVNESIQLPLEYYTNNLVGSINLLNAMSRVACRRLIFSSSATVYGLPQYNPVDERHPTGANILNPYGRTKFMIEQMLRDLCSTSVGWRIIALRYFNPVGAHPSGYIGEHSQGIPNNLMPYVAQVAIRKRDQFFVFGSDFDTPDGTGVRDYIHIMDLANGHIHALDRLIEVGAARNEDEPESAGGRFRAYNLGTGRGYSVLETIKTFEQVNKVTVPYEIVGRRQGDAGEVYADAGLALRELGWSASRSLTEMCRDTFRWQSGYPDGYSTPARPLDDGHNAEMDERLKLTSD